VKLVSFTVDPKRDTPGVLAKYAARQGARTGIWHFLTGEVPQIHDLSLNVFKLGSVDESLNHSTRFVLVDGRGRIRAYYGTLDGDPVPQVVADVRRLLRENS
jgi:protein SCO1/2